MKKRKEALQGATDFHYENFLRRSRYTSVFLAGGILRDHCFEYQYRKCGYLYPKDFKDYFSSGRK